MAVEEMDLRTQRERDGEMERGGTDLIRVVEAVVHEAGDERGLAHCAGKKGRGQGRGRR